MMSGRSALLPGLGWSRMLVFPRRMSCLASVTSDGFVHDSTADGWLAGRCGGRWRLRKSDREDTVGYALWISCKLYTEKSLRRIKHTGLCW